MPTLKKVPAYQDGQGVLHTSVESWQRAELEAALKPMLHRIMDATHEVGADNGVPFLNKMAAELIAGRDILLDILTTGPTSRPSTRKRAGTTSPRRAAKRATEAQAQARFKGMRDAANGVEPHAVLEAAG